MLGMMEGACKVGEGSWLWLPLVIADMMTGSPPNGSLSLAIVCCVVVVWWWKAGATLGAFKFPTSGKKNFCKGKPPEGDDHIPPKLSHRQHGLLIPLLPWAGIRLYEMGFSDNPKVVFPPQQTERECRVWNAELYAGAAPRSPFPKNFWRGEQDTTDAAAAAVIGRAGIIE